MEDKFLYFFITYTMEQRENQNGIDFVLPENKDLKPVCIYAEEIYKNQYYYNKIFKVKKSAGTGKKKRKKEIIIILNSI